MYQAKTWPDSFTGSNPVGATTTRRVMGGEQGVAVDETVDRQRPAEFVAALQAAARRLELDLVRQELPQCGVPEALAGDFWKF